MSVGVVHNLRWVRCPKCKLLLPENPEYDVYECGECGTKLKAKNRKSVAVDSESSAQKTDAASRNTVNLVSGDEHSISREQMAPPREDCPKTEATSSSSGECHLDGKIGRGQNENGECIEDELRPFNLPDEELETEMDIYKLSLRRRRRVSNKGGSNQTARCEIEEINSGDSLSEGSKDEFICALDEDGNNGKPALVRVMSEMEIGGSDSEVGEDFHAENLVLEGAEEEVTSRCDGECANDNKSTLGGANPEVEINGSELIKIEEFNSANLLQERAEDKLVSSPADENHELEIPRSDSEGREEFNNVNLLVEETEEKSVSGSDGEDTNTEKSPLAGANPEVEIANSESDGAEGSNDGNLLLKGPEEELSSCVSDAEDPNNDQSALVGAKPEADIAESTSTTESSSAENFVSGKERTLPVAPDKVEQGGSGNLASSHKLQNLSQKSIFHSFEHVRSAESLDTAEYSNPSSELNGTLGGFSKSPTARTRSSYAYYGSMSSYDGMDERFGIQHMDSFENTRMIANGVSEGMTRKGKGLVNSRVYGDLRTQDQSYSSNGKHHVMTDSRRNQNKKLETTRHDDRQWTRTRRDELPPRIPFHQSDSQSRYGSTSLSNQIHDEPYYMSRFLSHVSSEQSYQDKMELLRMIYKLQDQLKRTRYASRETIGRQAAGVFHKGKNISAFHNHDLHEGRFSHGLDYPGYNGRSNHEVNLRQRHKFSQTPYSDQATSSAHHVDHSCSHCYPKEWRFSADFSPRSVFHHGELCRSCMGQDCFTSHHSYPSSPQWITPSKLRVYGHGTQPDDQSCSSHELRRYSMEKQHLAKQKYKPVAGGAPFVTCHKCLNLLRLPADFLLSERGPHQLKCGECSEVLKFSLRNGSLVSYPSGALGPPSSGLNDQIKRI